MRSLTTIRRPDTSTRKRGLARLCAFLSAILFLSCTLPPTSQAETSPVPSAPTKEGAAALTAASALPLGNHPQPILRPAKPQLDTSLTQPPASQPTAAPKPGAADGRMSRPGATAKPGEPTAETYTLVAQLEEVTFGQSHPGTAIAERLSQLETTVFQKTYPHLSLEQRTQQLSDTLLGTHLNPEFHGPTPRYNEPTPGVHQPATGFQEPPLPEFGQPEMEATAVTPRERPDDPLWSTPEYQAELPREELDRFALEQINIERQQRGVGPLEWETVAAQMSKQHVEELARRSVVSHLNEAGHNPDLRYTRAGGTDAITEGLIVLPGNVAAKPNRATVMRILNALNSHQDDREALLSPDATHFGMGYDWTKGHEKLICCSAVVTKRGTMQPIPNEVIVGEKIEVKGMILPPYEFNRVTVAWEGLNKGASSFEESDEAMPYFPPLDYLAHSTKAEHGDHDKAITVLKTLGIVAAIGGGLFFPPIALAAPLIAMSGNGVGEPHAVSEIPVRGGMKIEGNTFSGMVPINNDGKEGLYYVTVWATSPHNGQPVPISRRIIIANGGDVKKKDGSQDNQ